MKLKILMILGTIMYSSMNFLVIAQELKLSGDVTGTSTYVWRGVKQFDGVSIQGAIGSKYKFMSFGIWYSTVNFGARTPYFETDPYFEFSLPTGLIKSQLGITVYCYDFTSYNGRANFEYELYGKLNNNIFNLAGYFLPNQQSVKNEVNQYAYWVEAGAGASLMNFTWGILFGYGTYSSRFLESPKMDAVGNVVLSATKQTSDAISVSWNYSLALDSGLTNILWISISRSL